MSDARGPSKQLAPATRPDSPCPHDYGNEDGLTAEVDCSECAGAQDIRNPRCFIGLANMIIAGAVPQSIILKRQLHKRYRGEAVRHIVQVADDLASIARAANNRSEASDKKCRTCPVSAQKILEDARRAIVRDPIAYVSNPSRLMEGLAEIARDASCDLGQRCADEVSVALVRDRGSA